MRANISLWLVTFVLLCITFVLFLWKRRKLYILSAKLKGPISFPLIGSAQIFYGGHKDLFTSLKSLFETYPGVSRVWFGPELYVIDGRPEDMDILLNGCLAKAAVYDFMTFALKDGLVTGPVDIWKKHRKLISQTFNSKVLLTFHNSFVKYANSFVDQVQVHSGKGIVDLFPLIFKNTIMLTCETLGDVNPDHLKGKNDYVWRMIRLEELTVDRMCSSYKRFNFLFTLLGHKQKMLKMVEKTDGFIKKLIDLKKSVFNLLGDDEIRKKRFLNYLLDANQQGLISEQGIVDETNSMMVAGSETTAITLGFVLIMLGFYPHVQENIFKELDMVLGHNKSDITAADVHKLEYLERVIKETLRVMSPVPVIGRHVQNDIKLSDGLEIPAGTNLFIPIVQMNKNPEIWDNPDKFDPDRFLPDKIKKMHRAAFIPFSFGTRNCVGFKYGMLNMKIFLAVFLSVFKVVDVPYKNKEDIKFFYAILVKPSDGCSIAIEKRTNS